MYNLLDEEWQSHCPTLPSSFTGLYRYAVRIFIVLSLTYTFIYWQDLTSCFKREAAILCCTMIYWHCAKHSFPGIIGELLIFTLIYWVGEVYNMYGLLASSCCLEPEGSPPLFLIKAMYKVLSILYTLSFFSLFTLSCMIFSAFVTTSVRDMIERRHRRRVRNRGLGQTSFDELEEIEYKVGKVDVQNGQTTCSICLGDFNENESIIQLPICNHYFHRNCIMTWLQNSPGCPYCRANIKRNLKKWKRKNNLEGTPERVSIELPDWGPNHNSRPLLIRTI